MRLRYPQSTRGATLLLVVSGLLAGPVVYKFTPDHRPSTGSEPFGHPVSSCLVTQVTVDSANVLGHEKCLECHKSEVAAWQQSTHGKLAFQQLSLDKAKEFAGALGITGDLRMSMCVDCHGTRHSGGVIEGVSCESCHSASGPEDGGWFATHSDFGEGIEDRLEETPEHYEQRQAACRTAGMNGSSQIYDIAKNCLSCHSVPNEELVNAGHPTSNQFELVEWSQGEVRHNFQLDQSVNAEAPSLWLDTHWHPSARTPENRKKMMYVMGQLVDLETSLQSRATASDGEFATAVNRRISSAQRKLKKLDQIPEVQQALDAVSAIDRKSLKEFGDNDSQIYGDAANAVAQAGQAFAVNHADGNLPGDVEVPDKVMGESFGGGN